MEQPQQWHFEKIPAETRDAVRKKIESLHTEFGETFSVEETPDEYIVVQGERKTHIIKHAKILHMGDGPNADEIDMHDEWLLADVIEAQIRFPELETSGEQMKALDARGRTQSENKNSKN
ncbi:MAG: hypothetical protein AAB783_02635 [Patescibacteria group bacterium]